MISTTLFWLGLVVAVTIGFIYFRDLGDIVQMVMKVKRDDTLRFIRNEYKLVTVGLAAAALMTAAHFLMDAGPGWAFWTAIILSLLFYGFTYVWVHLGLRNQANSAQYFSIGEAVPYINPSSSVLVIENNGVARAHSDRELMQPHLAGDQEGLDGENVVMTYCSMANLGIGYKPEIEGEHVELTVMAQHGNNLILRDESSNDPIQHIYGQREHGGARGPGMTPWPTFRMNFSGFQKAYPDGQVFLNKPSRNPLVWLFDFVTNLALSGGIEIQHRANAPLMDNMTNEDERLPNKTYVWGVNIGDDAVCYTRDFIIEQDSLINTNIGGRAIVISWDALYDSVGAYYNDTGTQITEIDFYGNTPQGELPRVEMLKSGLFWHVWVEFFPNTDINR
jgi:hypothetical protein